jgi:ribonuclease P/MRP protein subunit RPP40
VHPLVLKECRQELLDPLESLFRFSLASGTLPQDWRDADISAIHKGGTDFSPNFFRPISLTSVAVKVLEKLVKKRLNEFLSNTSFYAEEQHGFREGRSCSTNLLLAAEEYSAAKDEGIPTDCIFFDFAKAFDKTPHARMMGKVRKSGVMSSAATWLEAFLTGRRQRVKIRQSASDWAPVVSGIPQGSILGPVLFCIFVNDLPKVSNSPTSLFADDTKLSRQARSDSDVVQLQGDVDAVEGWAEYSKMVLNDTKTVHITYGQDHLISPYKLGDKVITSVKQQKDLGVLMDDSLKMNHHIKKIVGRSLRVLGSIRRTLSSRSKSAMARAFKVLVRPYLESCATIWSPHQRSDINRLESVQSGQQKWSRASGTNPTRSG